MTLHKNLVFITCIFFIAIHSYASNSKIHFSNTQLNQNMPELPAYTYVNYELDSPHNTATRQHNIDATNIYEKTDPTFRSIKKHIERRIATSPTIKTNHECYDAQLIRTYDCIYKKSSTLDEKGSLAHTAYIIIERTRAHNRKRTVIAFDDTQTNFTINQLALTINENDLISLQKK